MRSQEAIELGIHVVMRSRTIHGDKGVACCRCHCRPPPVSGAIGRGRLREKHEIPFPADRFERALRWRLADSSTSQPTIVSACRTWRVTRSHRVERARNTTASGAVRTGYSLLEETLQGCIARPALSYGRAKQVLRSDLLDPRSFGYCAPAR